MKSTTHKAQVKILNYTTSKHAKDKPCIDLDLDENFF